MALTVAVLGDLPPVMDPQRNADSPVATVAFAIVGLCTLVIYAMVIRRGFLDRAPALPVLAVCSNISWEFTYAFVYPIYPQMRYTLFFWLPLNAVILFQAVRYGRRDFPTLPPAAFYTMLAGWTAFSLSFMITATREFDDRLGVYTTVFDVVLMEALFIVMLRTRRSTLGQTMYIACLKTVVDVSGAVGLMVWYPDRWLLLQMIVFEVVLDLLYLGLLYRQFQSEGRPAWRTV